MNAPLSPDAQTLWDHFNALFVYADADVFIAHRAYTEGVGSRSLSRIASRVGDGHVADDAIRTARLAANHETPCVYCPPIAGFSCKEDASEKALIEAYAVSVDCDQHPDESRALLEACLGAATEVVYSGGVWINPTTGCTQNKVHLHWRLTEPATGEQIETLKQVRRLAAQKIGADKTGANPVHPFRAPGGWHRKGDPKPVATVALNLHVEIDLADALEKLRAMLPAPWVAEQKPQEPSNRQLGESDDRELAELLNGILTGEAYHQNLVPLSARLVGAGMYPGAVVTHLRTLMQMTDGPRDPRWSARFQDIPRIVDSAQGKFGLDWPDPKPLPSALPAVAPFSADLVPVLLRPWVMDIAERMQCPVDYVAVTAMVAAGSVIGRRVGVRAQAHTDWTEVPNLWAMVVGRPGVMKSPAMGHALKPIRRLDALAALDNEKLRKAHEAEKRAYDAEKKASNDSVDEPPEKPQYKRYMVNDSSYEALGEIMADNPNGTMVYRDELVSLLRPLGREDGAAARGFYLEAWNGNSGYTFDRIKRGRIHIEACCLSLLGAAQPGRLVTYLNDAIQGGAEDDGLAQRFGLLVWPDVDPHWKDIDREPDAEGRRTANFVFDRLNGLDPAIVGAVTDEYDPIPYLRFAPDALEEFQHFRGHLEKRLRGSDLHDAMASHLNKYRGMIPKLALITHLANGGVGPVSHTALLTALAWGEYLETHASRAYASVTSRETTAATALWKKIAGGALPNPFTNREVCEKGWSSLADTEAVKRALAQLVDLNRLAPTTLKTGGAPKTVYAINPKGLGQ